MDDEAVAALNNDLIECVRILHDSDARTEILAEYVDSRRRWGIRFAAALKPIGRVWRLGVLLLDREGNLHTTGQLIRATPAGRPQYVSLSAQERRDYRAAAERGNIPSGETVNFNTQTLTVSAPGLAASDGALFVQGGVVWVRWSAQSVQPREARAYIAERVELLVSPPEGT